VLGQQKMCKALWVPLRGPKHCECCSCTCNAWLQRNTVRASCCSLNRGSKACQARLGSLAGQRTPP